MHGKLLFVLDDFTSPAAGTEGQFDMLYRGLLEKGENPTVVTFRHSPYLAEHLPKGRYVSLNITSLSDPRSWYKAVQFALAARLDGFRLAHLLFNDTSVLLPPLLWLFGIKTLISRRDLGFWYTPGLLKALRVNRFFVTKVLANCQAVKVQTCLKEGYSEQKVAVILNGVQKPKDIPPMRLRMRLQAPQQSQEFTVFGMVANLRPLKRIEDAIRALAVLKEEGLAVRLAIAGADVLDEKGGSQQAYLQALAGCLDVHQEVLFTGSLNPAWGFLDEIDVLLSCSDTEGLSNSIIEAMACDKAVIATEVGGSPDVVQKGLSGLLYAPRDLPALTQAMRLLAADKTRRVRMGQAGGQFVRSKMTQEALLQAHTDLYRGLLGH